MKKNLLYFLMPLMFLFGGCNKERFEGEYDLNNDGNFRMVLSRNCSKGHILYSPKGNFDIDTIYNFGGKVPEMVGFNHENEDNYLDLFFYMPEKEGSVRYVVYSKAGELLRGKVEKHNK